jgi:hypothetical protein
MSENMIAVTLAPGWKCGRCWKILPEVGLCMEYPNACLRCAAAVAEQDGMEIELDPYVLAAKRFDTFLQEGLKSGLDLSTAVKQAGRLNSGIMD